MPQPLPKGARAGPGVQIRWLHCSSVHWGRTRVARLPLCREVAHGAHNLEQYRAWRCLLAVRGSAPPGTRVFAPQGFFPRGFAPLGCFLPQCACFRRAASCHAVVQRQPIPSSTSAPCPTGPRPVCSSETSRPCCRTQGVPRADRRLCAPLHGQDPCAPTWWLGWTRGLHPGRGGGL